MLPLRIFTFNGLSIVSGEQPLSGFISRKVEALLVYLAFERREHQRELLAEMFWDDRSQERAMGNLRTALWNLQNLLPDHVIVTRQTAMINPESDCWLDALVLSAALKGAEAGSASSTKDLEAALSLYKGDFLAGFHIRDASGFEGWMLLESQRLRGKVSEALQRLLRTSIDRGDYINGAERSRQLLALDAFSEEAHRGLMLSLARSGQRAAALAQYESCVRLLREELDVAPEPETTRLFAQIQTEQQTAAQPSSPKPTISLPIPSTPFIARPVELGQIGERLDNPDCRLLTIVGPGGIGKTRLALQSAAIHAEKFRDGVFYVSLLPVQSADFLPLEIAGALHFALSGNERPLEELIGFLADKQLLLVLDNFDQLVNSAQLLAEILGRAPGVRMLITSREWLNLQEEWVLPIDGMAFPSVVTDNAIEFSAVQLFVSCAQRIRPRFSLKENLDSVVKICQLVEGMPLSIELAATWLRALSAPEIVEHVNVEFLSTSARNVPERHRSVQAVFGYSWNLLNDEERSVLMKLSVFKGFFDRTAAQQVAGATVPILASLVEKSLIRLGDQRHYDIHELLRQYAFARLVETSEDSLVRNAHLDYYVQLTMAPGRIHGESQSEWLDRLEQEHENLSTALSWALESPTAYQAGLRLGAHLWEYWWIRGHIAEGKQWLDSLLDVTAGTVSAERAEATQGAGFFAYLQGDNDRAEALHKEGLAIRTALNDKAGMGGSLSNLGLVALRKGNFAEAQSYYEQALVLRREAGYTVGVASVLVNLMSLSQEQCQYDRAIACAEEAWQLFEGLNDAHGMALIKHNLASLTYLHGDWERSCEIYQEAIVLWQRIGDERATGEGLLDLGYIMADLGNYPQAHRYLEESDRLLATTSDKRSIAFHKRSLARLALAEKRFEEAQSLVGESLNLFQVLDENRDVQDTMNVQGDIFRAMGDLARAESTYLQGLANFLKLHDRRYVANTLYRLVNTASARGEYERAVVLLGTADSMAEQLRIRFRDEYAQVDRQALECHLSAENYEKALAKGKAMNLADLSEYLVSALPGAKAPG